MTRIHWGSLTTSAGGMLVAPCGVTNTGTGRALRWSDRRKAVTCKRCRVWLRLMYPRPRNLPLAKRKLHFYGPGLDEVTARCGMYNHMGLITGKMRNVTCGRCKRLLGLRPWRPKLIRPNCELVEVFINRTGATIAHRIDRNELRRTQPMSEFV